MSKINEAQIVEDVKGEMLNWVLEQKINNLEHTLSDTISFFSTTFAIVGIVVTILLVIAAWWLNQLFNTKLEKVKEFSESASKHKEEIEKIQTDINITHNSIKEMFDFIKSNKDEVASALDNQQNNQNWLDFLEEKYMILECNQKFLMLIDEVEAKLKTITKKDIENYYVDEFEGSPESQFEYQKKYYIDAKNKFLEMQKQGYTIKDFMEDKGMEYEPLSGEILSEFGEAEGFLEELNKIKNHN